MSKRKLFKIVILRFERNVVSRLITSGTYSNFQFLTIVNCTFGDENYHEY